MRNEPCEVLLEAKLSSITLFILAFMLVLFVTLIVIDLVLGKGLPSFGALFLAEYFSELAIVSTVFGGFILSLYFFVNMNRVTITKGNIKGRTGSMKRVQFSTDSITKIEMVRNPVASTVEFSSEESPDKIVLPVLGLLGFKKHSKLEHLLGPNHIVTKWVKQYAT